MKYDDPNLTYGNLPHWHANKSLMFVTFRLADSLPAHAMNEVNEFKWQYEMEHPRPWDPATAIAFESKRAMLINDWLDRALGCCLLRDPYMRKIVIDALYHFDGERYRIRDYVIMPNHVHMIIETFENYKLQQIMQSLKRFTAREINKVLNRTGVVWEREYFDRIIRSPRHYWTVVKYIERNPKKFSTNDYALHISSI